MFVLCGDWTRNLWRNRRYSQHSAIGRQNTTVIRCAITEVKPSFFLPLSHYVGSVQHVVIKIRHLFLRSAACMTSTFLETGVDTNDCKCSRDQQLNVPSEARRKLEIINFGHPSNDWPLRSLLIFRVQTLSALTAQPSSSSYGSEATLAKASHRIGDHKFIISFPQTAPSNSHWAWMMRYSLFSFMCYPICAPSSTSSSVDGEDCKHSRHQRLNVPSNVA
jgi:hypothetical protein